MITWPESLSKDYPCVSMSTWTGKLLTQQVKCFNAVTFIYLTLYHTLLASSIELLPLLSCLDMNCQARPTIWRDMALGVSPCLTIYRHWWSQSEARMPVSFVTQLTVDRLPALSMQCELWAGPLCAVVHIGIEPGRFDKVYLAAEDIDKLFSNRTAAYEQDKGRCGSGLCMSGCQLRMILVYEVLGDTKAELLYPVNTLRNYARLMASTPLVANIDVDMLPSVSLSRDLLLKTLQQEVIVPPSSVLVIPAFQTTCGGYDFAKQVTFFNKTTLRNNKCVIPFNFQTTRKLHGSTDFRHWFSLGPGTRPYPVPVNDYYEPWFISTSNATFYDTRYRGFGKNKIQQVLDTSSRGTTFLVHTSGFLVHFPHQISPASRASHTWSSKLAPGSLINHNRRLWLADRRKMKMNMFNASLDNATKRCLIIGH